MMALEEAISGKGGRGKKERYSVMYDKVAALSDGFGGTSVNGS